MTSPSVQPRKVLHVMNTAGGGAAMSTLGLIDGLRRRGVESCVVCHTSGSPDDMRAVAAAIPGGVRFLRLVWWNKKLRAPLWKRPLMEARQLAVTGAGYASAARLAGFARAQGADLIHTNTVLTPEGARAAAWLNLPHVWHVRELIGPGNPFQFAGGAAGLGRRLGAGDSIIVANSEQSAQGIRAYVPAERFMVVPNGIDLARFADIPPRAHQPGRVVFGMVANVTSHWKKHALFVEAVRALDPERIEARIYGQLAGDSYEAGLRARAGDRVSFRGHVDPATIMREIDVLVHPADQESFGRVVVEAMAAGLPVVGVAGGGVSELVVHDETGLLVPPDDAAALAAAMQRVSVDGALRVRFGAAGRRRAYARYSLDACVDGVLEAYARAFVAHRQMASVGAVARGAGA